MSYGAIALGDDLLLDELGFLALLQALHIGGGHGKEGPGLRGFCDVGDVQRAAGIAVPRSPLGVGRGEGLPRP